MTQAEPDYVVIYEPQETLVISDVGVQGPPGPKGDKGDPGEIVGEGGQVIQGPKGDKGDSVTAGQGAPSTIIPGVSVFIDAISGNIYVYEAD